MEKTPQQRRRAPSDRVAALVEALEKDDLDGKEFVERFGSLEPHERAQLVGELLKTYKALAEAIDDE